MFCNDCRLMGSYDVLVSLKFVWCCVGYAYILIHTTFYLTTHRYAMLINSRPIHSKDLMAVFLMIDQRLVPEFL